MWRWLWNCLLVMAWTLTSWVVLWWLLAYAQTLPRLAFVLVHYGLIILVFGSLFLLYYHTLDHFAAWETAALAVISVVVIQFIFQTFFYQGTGEWLTVADWLIPTVITAGVVYSVREIV
ncbi:MAG: hypothetical protein AAB817_03230 [Patescibacteria group bacterium]